MVGESSKCSDYHYDAGLDKMVPNNSISISTPKSIQELDVECKCLS